MTQITVIEPEAGEIAREISQRLWGVSEVGIKRVCTAGEIPDGADILVVSASCTEACESGTGRSKPHCRLMLLPDGYGTGFVQADCVVTYGMNVKNSLTLSSIGERECVLSLQRELVTAGGEIIDRQELIVRGGGIADDILAVSGALLLLGITPE